MPDDKKMPTLSFRLDGEVAELFERAREAAKQQPEFWIYARLTKADFARHLLMRSLLEVSRELGVYPSKEAK